VAVSEHQTGEDPSGGVVPRVTELDLVGVAAAIVLERIEAEAMVPGADRTAVLVGGDLPVPEAHDRDVMPPRGQDTEPPQSPADRRPRRHAVAHVERAHPDERRDDELEELDLLCKLEGLLGRDREDGGAADKSDPRSLLGPIAVATRRPVGIATPPTGLGEWTR
jgi:hypothetical protein